MHVTVYLMIGFIALCFVVGLIFPHTNNAPMISGNYTENNTIPMQKTGLPVFPAIIGGLMSVSGLLYQYRTCKKKVAS